MNLIISIVSIYNIEKEIISILREFHNYILIYLFYSIFIYYYNY